MIHYRAGPKTVYCHARSGLRTDDVWRVNCEECWRLAIYFYNRAKKEAKDD